jgi:aspartate aminotransferase
MPVTHSEFALSVTVEGAFGVLAVAKQLKAAGKEVIELEIGDSPFPSPTEAKEAAIAAIRGNQTHYCPSLGLPELRAAAAGFLNAEFGLPVSAANIVVGCGAKIFETLFCQAFLSPGDGVLVFSPYFPTYLPNIAARGGEAWIADLRQEHGFRPDLAAVERFIGDHPRPKAIFLNSPHNPTGGVATEDDLRQIADLVRGRDIAILSDEPYCHMAWRGQHHSILAQPGMIAQCVAAYTFSKSYSMSGWRLGFAAASPETAEILGRLANISISCVPPPVQLAGVAALQKAAAERDYVMRQFREKVRLLAEGLSRIDGILCLDPGGAFYVFPSVKVVCNRLGITSMGLSMFLLEGADDRLGVACLGGECFGAAGAGFLRFSCAEPDDRLRQALEFIRDAFTRCDRVDQFLAKRPQYRLDVPYST